MLSELLKTTVSLRLDKAQECLNDAVKNIEINAYATAVNRSYYCIFHAMRAVLVTVGFTSKTHSGNIAEFRRSFIKTGVFPIHFSDIIGDAFDIRNDSDYEDFYLVDKAEVVRQTENAKIFLEAVEVYIGML